MMTDAIRRQVCVGAGVAATVLVDGTVAATWSVTRADGTATLTVRPLRPLTGAGRDAVEAEGAALLAFAHPDADPRITEQRPGCDPP
ncbi:MAG: hypothetical protein GEV11_28275 [Streptosporangiales bacterium]|nr:hypothetical protein [Streptosporangiales bacterium]